MGVRTPLGEMMQMGPSQTQRGLMLDVLRSLPAGSGSAAAATAVRNVKKRAADFIFLNRVVLLSCKGQVSVSMRAA